MRTTAHTTDVLPHQSSPLHECKYHSATTPPTRGRISDHPPPRANQAHYEGGQCPCRYGQATKELNVGGPQCLRCNRSLYPTEPVGAVHGKAFVWHACTGHIMLASIKKFAQRPQGYIHSYSSTSPESARTSFIRPRQNFRSAKHLVPSPVQQLHLRRYWLKLALVLRLVSALLLTSTDTTLPLNAKRSGQFVPGQNISFDFSQNWTWTSPYEPTIQPHRH